MIVIDCARQRAQQPVGQVNPDHAFDSDHLDFSIDPPKFIRVEPLHRIESPDREEILISILAYYFYHSIGFFYNQKIVISNRAKILIIWSFQRG